MNKLTSTIEDTSATSKIESFNGILERELMKRNVCKKMSPLILSLSVNPNSGYNTMKQIRDRFHIDVGPSKVHPKLKHLEKMGYIIRQKDPHSPKNRKTHVMSSEGENFFLAYLEADKRILTYATHLPIQPKIFDKKIENGLMKKLLRDCALNEAELLVLNSLMDGPNHSFGIIKNIEKGIDIHLYNSTVEPILSDLLKRRTIDFDEPGCPECGKPPGWRYEDGRWKLIYKIKPYGEFYLRTGIKSAFDLLGFMANSFMGQKGEEFDVAEWLYLRPKPPETKKPYVIEVE